MSHKKTAARGVAALAGFGLAVGMLPAVTATAAPAANENNEPQISSEVTAELEEHGTADVVLKLRGDADLSAAYGMSWEERGDFVYETLQAHAEKSQADLVSDLDAAGATYQTFWINNTIIVEDATADLITTVTSDSTLSTVTVEKDVELIDATPAAGTAPTATEWGLDAIKAPQIWDTYGQTGEGIVVGTFDTGVDGTHPALAPSYRGTESGSDDYNWFDPSGASPSPTDTDEHGTHVTGTMVGLDGANQIGVAPGAQWIAASGCCRDDIGEAELWETFEWFVAPTKIDGTDADTTKRPHIVNNSWGFSGHVEEYEPLESALASWNAEGIFGVFASGNSGPEGFPVGPECDNVNSPAWNNGAAYVVANHQEDGSIAPSSSRGPGEDGEPGVDITAPGTAVRSSIPGGSYAEFTGTSMASPHVSGSVALLWGEFPELVGDIAGTQAVLDAAAIDTADPSCGGSEANNETFGEGKLDLVALFESLDEPEPGPEVERVFGSDRYQTAGEISELYPDGVDTVYVTSGQGFPDALTGSSAAAQGLFPAGVGTMETPDGEPAPVLLTRQSKLTTSTSEYLEALNPANIVILGGTGTVGQAVEDTLNERFDATVDRIAGENRYETAAALASLFPQDLPVVYVASGVDDAYPDALTGSALAGKNGAPVLLTKTDSVPGATAAALAELNPQSVVVLGGSAAVSDAVYAELGADDRLSGANRYETAVDVSSSYDTDAPVVYIASGVDYPDALSSSALAGSEDAPVLITRQDKLPNTIVTELNRLSPERVVIVGGTAAVSQSIEDQLNELYPGWIG